MPEGADNERPVQAAFASTAEAQGATAAANAPEAAADPGLVEVTPEMIKAGLSVFWEGVSQDDRLEADRLTVERIYRAMCHLAARPSPGPSSQTR